MSEKMLFESNIDNNNNNNNNNNNEQGPFKLNLTKNRDTKENKDNKDIKDNKENRVKFNIDTKTFVKENNELMKKDAELCTICSYLILIILFIIYIYIIRPFNIIISIYYLVKIATLDKDSKSTGKLVFTSYFTFPYPIIGFLIIFVVPLVYYIHPGTKIIALQETKIAKLFSFFLILIEAIIEIPFPFLYDNNMFSIFLFDEDGAEKLLSPWLVFYPTAHVLSVLEICKNTLFSLFFLITSIMKYEELVSNKYNSAEITILYILMSFSIITLCYHIIFLFLKLNKFCFDLNEEKEKEKEKENNSKVNIEMSMRKKE